MKDRNPSVGELIKYTPLTDEEKKQLKNDAIVVVKSVSSKEGSITGYTTHIFKNVPEAFKYYGDKATHTDPQCIFDLNNGNLIHVEDSESGLTEALLSMIEISYRDAFDLQEKYYQLKNEDLI